MIDNNRAVPAKKDIEKQLSLIFDPQICPKCRQDHSFKNNFEDVETSIDDFLAYLENRISITIPIADACTPNGGSH
jgi:hypothetical protein